MKFLLIALMINYVLMQLEKRIVKEEEKDEWVDEQKELNLIHPE